MQLDIRTPIGLMFLVFGVALTLFGLLSPAEIYERSLGININLWWGLAQCIFGVAFLWAALRKKPDPPKPLHSAETRDQTQLMKESR